MDWGSVAGLSIALIGLLLGQAVEGGQIASLVQPAALMIVLFGTFGAVLLQSNYASFTTGLAMAKQVFVVPNDDRHELIARINAWAVFARKEGIFMLENFLSRESEPFIRKGLQLMIDGTPPDRIREICAIDMHFYEAKQRSAARIWSAAGGYAPTIGILGAVIGLIQVMENLSDPSKLGSGIAIAFVATIYGVALANLVFLPIASKLKTLINQEMMRREMLLNAWVSIARGDHPKIVDERLQSYLH